MAEKFLGTYDMEIATAADAGQSLTVVSATSLFVEQEILPAAARDTFAWKNTIPGQLAWRCEGGYFDAATFGQREASQAALEAALFSQSVVRVRLFSPVGSTPFVAATEVTYTGDAYVASLQGGGSVLEAMASRFAFVGKGPLYRDDDIAEAMCGTGDSALDYPDLDETRVITKTYNVGITAGTITVTYYLSNKYAQQLEILYDGAVVADTGSGIHGSGTLTYDYAAAPGTPMAITVRVTVPAQPVVTDLTDSGWAYNASCPVPA